MRREKASLYRTSRPENAKDSVRKWRSVNADAVRAAKRNRYAANIEKERALKREWYNSNYERLRIMRREYWQRNALTMREHLRKRYHSNPEKWLARNREWRASNLRSQLFLSAKHRAKAVGLPFSITVNDISFPDDMRCPILGIPLRMGKGYRCHGSPSLDRIDNNKGYIPGNVRVISWRANVLKRDATLSELLALVEDAKRINGIAA